MTIVASFESTRGEVSISLSPSSVTLVAGPNGVGKSALLNQLYRTLPLGVATYLPGHRQINLNQSIETLGQDLAQLRQNFFNGWDAFNRYRGAWSEDQFKGTLRTLVNAEHAFNRAFRKAVASDQGVAASATLDASPIDQLNVVFSHAGLPVSFALTDTGLTAERAGTAYAVEALSDGERAALFLAAAVITQDAGTVLLIDEPEKHLHPSITGLLLETSLRANNTIAVVVSSHDITLIERLAVQSTIYVKESEVISLRPERRRFDVEILTEGTVPEQLRIDVLGARSAILYVEGTERSRDAALYAHVYPAWKVISKGSAEKVIEATRGVRSAKELHWLRVVGLIDGDGRERGEGQKLAAQGIIVLPCPTIENLFFLEEAQQCFVNADLTLRGGLPFSDRQSRLKNVVLQAARAQRDQIVARRALWRTQREIGSQALSVNDIREDRVASIAVDVAAVKASVATEVDALLAGGDVQQLLIELPIKNTDVPDVAARALGAGSFKAYCQTIQRQMDLGTESGLNVRTALRALLPALDDVPHAEVVDLRPPESRSVGVAVASAIEPPVLSA